MNDRLHSGPGESTLCPGELQPFQELISEKLNSQRLVSPGRPQSAKFTDLGEKGASRRALGSRHTEAPRIPNASPHIHPTMVNLHGVSIKSPERTPLELSVRAPTTPFPGYKNPKYRGPEAPGRS